MQYYRSKITNLIVSGNYAKALNYVYGKNTIEKLVEEHTLEEIKEPSVIDCVRYGSGSVAVVRYRELHPEASWDEASAEIRKIRKDIYRHMKKGE